MSVAAYSSSFEMVIVSERGGVLLGSLSVVIGWMVDRSKAAPSS